MSHHIMSEFSEVFEQVSKFGSAVSILGSSRVASDDLLYTLTKEIAQILSSTGYNIITGAGTGLMQAANEGAKLGHCASIGLMVNDPYVGGPNPAIDHCFYLKDVGLRIQTFLACSDALIFLPGGLGTFDELSGFLLQNQWRPEKTKPIFLIDAEFWTPIIHWLQSHMEERKFIEPKDLSSIYLVNSIDDILKHLQEKH